MAPKGTIEWLPRLRILTGIAEDVLPEAPKVTGEQSRLVLTLAERDQNKVQRAFMRRLSGGEQDR
ncbi:MAG: hypothetical protein ACTINN_07810 [Brachybacterium tyrofermentans]